MNILRTYLPLTLILFFAVINVSYSQVVQEKIYTKWLDCGGLKVAVSDNPGFQRDGIEAYLSGFGAIVFVEEGKSTYCASLGFGWNPDGFVYGERDTEPNRKALLFKVSGGEVERYFDIKRKKEVYHISTSGEKLTISDTPLAPAQSSKVIKILQTWQGNDSKITQTEYHRIISEDEWNNLWQRHNKNNIPKVDFTKHMIIAILLGRTVNTKDVVAEITETDTSIQFRFNDRSYQTAGHVDEATPFGFFMIPRSAKKIRIEENVQNMIGGPLIWKLRAEFDEL